MFRSFAIVDFRTWFIGALISNVGRWMQRTAQDWLVLTELTDNNAVALGIVLALQFGPALILMPVSGLIADRFARRTLLIITQASMGALALALGVLTVGGWVELWHVYVFALLLGVVSAFDDPPRQTFVSDLVEGRDLQNAVALNSSSYAAARMIGPATAGLLTALIGAGPVFLISSLTFVATIVALMRIRPESLTSALRAVRARGQIREGFRYIAGRSDIVVILVGVSIVGTFGMNFPVYTATMASIEFQRGAADFGVLMTALAVGSLSGALVAARGHRPGLLLLFLAALGFGLSCLLSALMPSFWVFAASLVFVGVTSQMLMTTANATVQLTTDPTMRGRVVSVYMAIFVGGAPLGAPFLGWIANEFGPRWTLGVGAASGVLAFALGIVWMLSTGRIRILFDRTKRLLFRFERAVGSGDGV